MKLMHIIQLLILFCAFPICYKSLYVSQHAKYAYFGPAKFRWLILAFGYALKGTSVIFMAVGVQFSWLGLVIGAALVALSDRRSGAKRMYYP